MSENDRLANDPESYIESMRIEASFLANLGADFWMLLLPLLEPGNRWQAIRSDVLYSMHIMIAFLDRRVFEELRSEPWTLCRGSILDNLVRLRGLPFSRHPFVRQLQRLLRYGCEMDELVELVSFLKLIAWSTKKGEELHAKTAQAKRWHKAMSTSGIMARAFASAVLYLFKVDPPDRRDKKLEARRFALLNMNPNKNNRHTVMVKQACDLLSSKTVDKSGSFRRNVECVKKLSELSQNLTQVEKDVLDEKKIEHIAKRRREISFELEEIATEQFIRQKRANAPQLVEEFARDCGTIRMCESDVAAFQSIWDGERPSAAEVVELRDQALVEPALPTISQRAALASQPFYDGGRSVNLKKPVWLSTLCRGRDIFSGAVLSFRVGGDTLYFKYMFAKQAPYQASLAPLLRIDAPLDSCCAAAPLALYPTQLCGGWWCLGILSLTTMMSKALTIRILMLT